MKKKEPYIPKWKLEDPVERERRKQKEKEKVQKRTKELRKKREHLEMILNTPQEERLNKLLRLQKNCTDEGMRNNIDNEIREITYSMNTESMPLYNRFDHTFIKRVSQFETLLMTDPLLTITQAKKMGYEKINYQIIFGTLIGEIKFIDINTYNTYYFGRKEVPFSFHMKEADWWKKDEMVHEYKIWQYSKYENIKSVDLCKQRIILKEYTTKDGHKFILEKDTCKLPYEMMDLFWELWDEKYKTKEVVHSLFWNCDVEHMMRILIDILISYERVDFSNKNYEYVKSNFDLLSDICKNMIQ